MAIEIREETGRSQSLTDATKWYYVTGATDESQVIDAIKAASPATQDGRVRDDISITGLADDRWEGTVSYVLPTVQAPLPPVAGGAEVSFESATETVRVTKSHEVMWEEYLSASGDQTSGNGGDGKPIRVRADGTAEGIDAEKKYRVVRETHHFDVADIDSAYMAAIESLDGSVNAGAFRGVGAGQVRILDITSSTRGNIASITFVFGVRHNEPAGITVGDLTTRKTLEGWDYLDIETGEEYNSDDELINNGVIALIAHRLYPRKNFASLNIGTGGVLGVTV